MHNLENDKGLRKFVSKTGRKFNLYSEPSRDIRKSSVSPLARGEQHRLMMEAEYRVTLKPNCLVARHTSHTVAPSVGYTRRPLTYHPSSTLSPTAFTYIILSADFLKNITSSENIITKNVEYPKWSWAEGVCNMLETRFHLEP